MIQEIKNTEPFINFEFLLTHKQIPVGIPVTVWLTSLFNLNDYDVAIVRNGATMIKVSDYEYIITYAAAGSYEVYINILSKDKKTALKSNTLTITVI